MNIFEKLRALSEKKRKLIFWSVLIILSIFFLILWASKARTKLEQFKLEELKERIPSPSFENLELPTAEIEEDLKKLEELIQQAEQDNEPE